MPRAATATRWPKFLIVRRGRKIGTVDKKGEESGGYFAESPEESLCAP